MASTLGFIKICSRPTFICLFLLSSAHLKVGDWVLGRCGVGADCIALGADPSASEETGG